MDSQHVLYNKNYKPNDEALTPAYAIKPLLEFLPNPRKTSLSTDDGRKIRKRNYPIIWCAWDLPDSSYVKVLAEAGYEVIASHIDTGQDFMTWEPDQWDILIGNPPFTGKRHTFERALSFGKRFAILMSNTWLNDSAPKQLFEHKDLQLLMFDKRIKFGNQVQKGITFSSSYYCWHFLPKQIIMRRLIVK